MFFDFIHNRRLKHKKLASHIFLQNNFITSGRFTPDRIMNVKITE
jgi:hypothetical protein